MKSIACIDVSHWQDSVDFDAVCGGGVPGVILKCTESTDYEDPTFKARYAEAFNCGMVVSSYHFLRPGDMGAQMAHYLNTLDPADGERVVIDHEDPDVSLGDLKDAVRAIIELNPTLQITVYSGHLIKEQLGSVRDEFLADNTSLWIAHYTSSSSPTWPKETWKTWSLWQYTDQATVTGVSGPCDANRFNGSGDAFLAWMGPSGVEPGPQPGPEPEDRPYVTVTVEADRPIYVTLAVGENVIVVGATPTQERH